jgi:hypothetical protein
MCAAPQTTFHCVSAGADCCVRLFIVTSSGYDYINRETLTSGHVMQAAGYSTAHYGKWHNGRTLGYEPWQMGFQESWFPELYINLDNLMRSVLMMIDAPVGVVAPATALRMFPFFCPEISLMSGVASTQILVDTQPCTDTGCLQAAMPQGLAPCVGLQNEALHKASCATHHATSQLLLACIFAPWVSNPDIKSRQ